MLEQKITNALNRWFDAKVTVISNAFWNGLDTVSMIAMLSCLLLSIFGLEAPKRWMTWIVALYITARFIQYAIAAL